MMMKLKTHSVSTPHRHKMPNKTQLSNAVLSANCRRQCHHHNNHNLGNLLLFYSTILFIISSLSLITTANGCEMIPEGYVEKTIEERTNLADIVASGRVLRQHHPENRNKTNFLYAADVKILEIYKGYRHFENVSTVSASSTNVDNVNATGNVYRILGFGERKRCYSEAHKHQEYILFLTTYSMSSLGYDGAVGLTAKYADYHGAVEKFSNKHKTQVLSSLGK